MLAQRLEEHKIHQEEVRSHWDSKLGYWRARRTKPYQTARKSCCGGKTKTDEAASHKSKIVDRELQKLARRTRGGYGRYNSSGETDDEVRGDKLGGQVSLDPLAAFCEDDHYDSSSSSDERSSNDQDGSQGEESLIVFA